MGFMDAHGSRARMQQGASPAAHFAAFDGLRGLAALAIMLFHLSFLMTGRTIVPHGYLAVDFFFILSGFVVAHAYEARRQAGLSWGGFALLRGIRLYPLAMLGMAEGLLLLATQVHFHLGRYGALPALAGNVALNLALLPAWLPHRGLGPAMFPADDPLWTLFLELAANLLWAWRGPRLRTWQLAALVLAALIWLLVEGLRYGTLNAGPGFPTAQAGLARVCFGFPCGVLLFRLRTRFARWPGVPGWVLGVALLLALACPLDVHVALMPHAQKLPWWDLLCAALIFPAIIWAGAGSRVQARLLWRGLGDISYPVYALHMPAVKALSHLYTAHLHKIPAPLLYPVFIALIAACAWAAGKFYDAPVRRFLAAKARWSLCLR